MALVLDSTVGTTTANAYCTAVEGDSYHEGVLHDTDWTNATSNTKEAALVWATRLLDEQVDWNGVIKTRDQALRWPRFSAYDTDGRLLDSGTIPQWLKNATAELARHLIGKNLTVDPETAGFSSISLPGGLSFTIDKSDRIPTLPQSVRQMVSAYGFIKNTPSGIQTVNLVRS